MRKNKRGSSQPKDKPADDAPNRRKVSLCFMTPMVLSPVTITIATDVEVPGQGLAPLLTWML
jgi:hypothetical protein